MCVFHITWKCSRGYIFSWSMLLMKLNSCEDEWLVGMGALQEEKKIATKAIQKRKMLRSHLVCGQLINTCTLGANWNGQDFFNYKHWFCRIHFLIKSFSHFLCS